MVARILLACAVAVPLCAAGADLRTAAASAQASGTVRIIDQGDQSGVDEPRQVVVRTPDEWAKLWRLHGMDRARPKVDFNRETVAGVFMGSRPTAGFSVQVVEVAAEGGARVVRYRESAPGPGTMTAQVITSPYVIVAFPKTAGEVKFETVK